MIVEDFFHPAVLNPITCCFLEFTRESNAWLGFSSSWKLGCHGVPLQITVPVCSGRCPRTTQRQGRVVLPEPLTGLNTHQSTKSTLCIFLGAQPPAKASINSRQITSKKVAEASSKQISKKQAATISTCTSMLFTLGQNTMQPSFH